ncbi:MAG TPA: peroxiredoxin [Anaeromyxobacteraceae bacterium]|nr:peroxiredoxin [Anaeromyxobacteraceae bacterium]
MVTVLQKAPDFRAPAVTGKGEVLEVALSDHAGKWVVLFFYPLDFTAVCPTEILEFSKRSREFEALGAVVLGCSVDSQHAHKAWIEKGGLGEVHLTLVADLTKSIARSYGALLEEKGFATRATYIVDPHGLVQYACYHNTAVGRSVSETLRVLEALQTGEKCPVEWRPGGKTLGR